MNVIILQDYLRGGGTERQSIELTFGLLERNHHAELWVGQEGGALDEIARQKLDDSVNFLGQSKGYLRPLLKLRRLLAMKRQPYALLLMGRWSHLVANFLPKHNCSIWASTVRTSRSLPFLYRKTILRSDHLLTNSHWAQKSTAEQLSPATPPPNTVIHNGLSRQELLHVAPCTYIRTKSRKKILINVARLEAGKGQDDLIRMLQILDDRNIHLWLLGIGPEQVALEQLAEAFGVADQVHFKGFQEDVGSFFANSHLFVTASQLDSLPNSLIEAHAAGLPIVAYDSMGIPEIVSDSQTGFLSPTHTPEALSKLCNKLLVNETLNTQFAIAARKRVRKMFDREQQNQKFCSTIESIFAE